MTPTLYFPSRLLGLAAVLLGLAGCASLVAPVAVVPAAATSFEPGVWFEPLNQLLPADAILLGEQHDAPDHQRLHHFVIDTLAQRQALAGVVIEMASLGQSTSALQAQATEAQVRSALQWNDDAWPWQAYGPAVMAAVRAGVPVWGGNLPISRQRAAMQDPTLAQRLPSAAWLAQQQLIRSGHCDLLPEAQIIPMTRIQIARDLAMAQAISQAAVSGKTVVLLAGSGHVNRELGVPLHLPTAWTSRAVLLRTLLPSAETPTSGFDHIWTTRAVEPVDYCASFGASLRRMTAPPKAKDSAP
jgi:uncharacterized iron-regulated protein